MVNVQGEFDDAVITNIENFVPHRNEFITVINYISTYTDSDSYAETVHSFFEKLAKYSYAPQEAGRYTNHDFDNFKFIIQELFLYTIAIFIKKGKLEYARMLMKKQYYVERRAHFKTYGFLY